MDIEDNGDDLLMAWEQYSKPRTLRCCGREIALTPPDWWYRFTKTQRRWMICLGGCMTTFTLLLLILVAAAAARKHLFKGGHAAGDLCDWTDWRLPPSVHPHRYNLTFDVQMDEPFDVQGEEGIEIHLEHPSRCVVLHVTGMQVVEARLGNADGPPAVRRYNDALEQLTLEWDSEIPAGHTALYFSFKYRLSRGMSGFYRSVYPAAEGDDRIMAATQFEANSARAAFPCFDEPELKAEFAIEVITSNEMVVLSNMPTAVAHHVSGTRHPHTLVDPDLSAYTHHSVADSRWEKII